MGPALTNSNFERYALRRDTMDRLDAGSKKFIFCVPMVSDVVLEKESKHTLDIPVIKSLARLVPIWPLRKGGTC